MRLRLPNSNIYIVSDYHAFHKNIAYGSSTWEGKNGTRPFRDEFEMTSVLAENTNRVVGENDILIHLGDWSFGGRDNIRKFRDMIKCRTIINLLGNHDHHIANGIHNDCFDKVLSYAELNIGKTLVVLCHYPLKSWNEIGRGSVMLHGHCHGNLGVQNGRIKDIGVECIGYTPILLNDVVAELVEKPIFSLDHHQSDNVR